MATDSKKEAFRRFLETAGVIDMLTKSLVQLYEEPEKPGNAIDYVRTAFGAPTPAEFDAMTEEKGALEEKVALLEAQIKEMALKIHELENPPTKEEDTTASE
mmetsp:Transcript_4876/g.8437  ORF Transcript_4876/g.8437 Transcript_4876/m.8437 type:complete len:102 (-) Transcript_4876:429-734(-)|eukprot:CAMPEP_0198212974 /NCGR_PEP_ID=MMETSP1445-20131203/28478_1 /TAXON_ID=36898 /ORGANISM="Pyramimonas sp., Strain CCMP2087" /LENGTH=101 /DNA_ID=CAMNT_0043887555 /DNA_START=53 /DNA_END=358 /DNA_ORIENTATION=-